MKRISLMMLVFALMVSAGSVVQADWNEGDAYKWVQYPDLSTYGIDVNATVPYKLADDFECTVTGPLTDFHIWCSWLDDWYGPDPAAINFMIEIYDDIPADPCGGMPYSMPGTLLWQHYYPAGSFVPRPWAEQIYEGWMDPPDWYLFPADFTCWQYNFFVDPCDPDIFRQQGSPDNPKIYWLAVQAQPMQPGPLWGWKTSVEHWNDDAVWTDGIVPWQELRYPPGHELMGQSIDLAFVITGEEEHTDELDWGDAPDYAPVGGGYPTLAISNGANHIIQGPWLGLANDAPDPEPDGQPEPAALGDDIDILYPPVNDDENGVRINGFILGQPGSIDFDVSGGGGVVQIWIDWNIDQIWQAGEQVVNAAYVNGTYTVPLTPPPGAVVGQTFLRARISINGGLSPVGPAPDGEVEDHELYIEEEQPDELDWGDAPDGPYPTLSASLGANHLIVSGGPWLGDATDTPDAEADGQPDPAALGDDNDGNDDEDGVNIPILQQGRTDTITYEVNGAAGGAWVKIWLDMDGDGVWQDPAEVIEDTLQTNGVYSINITPPLNSVVGQTFLRARISTTSGLPPTGSAQDGEVEDHEVIIEEGRELITKFLQRPQDGPDYFGHDELSTAYTWYDFTDPCGPMMIGYEGCYMADDFADPRTSDVVRVRWWGSYMEEVYEQPVVHFMIIFETDVPLGDPDNPYPYSHPGEVILAQEVWLGGNDPLALNPGEYSENLISGGGPPCNESLYEYEAFLEIPFDQEPDTVYWIKIVALVDVDPIQMQIVENCLIQHGIDLCSFLNLPLAQQMTMCPEMMPLTRWGWHNRDYEKLDQFASWPPAVIPGEHLVNVIHDPHIGRDLEIWHFQDDAVSGDIQIAYMAGAEPVIDQPTYVDEYYKYFWPLCPPIWGVDGPEEIEMYSKDLAFELLTPACLTPATAIEPGSGLSYYAEWILVGAPECWCCKSQCYGDGDCLLGGSSKTGFYHVGAGDLSQLLAAWKVLDPTKGPGIWTVPYGICADYDHTAHGSAKTGYYRVGAPDLA
ncbi:MAG: hypothetical protein JW860_11275, partial [Sedimentisphaerales bacterium]|nr:hypothetical protein [Sedimentisphaerales bacterium]